MAQHSPPSVAQSSARSKREGYHKRDPATLSSTPPERELPGPASHGPPRQLDSRIQLYSTKHACGNEIKVLPTSCGWGTLPLVGI